MLSALDGIVDVYLPDFKFYDDGLSVKYAGAPDYREVAEKAIAEMARQTGKPTFSDGILVKGTLVRHLVLPGHRNDSIKVIKRLAEMFDSTDILVSLMSQYTPTEGGGPSRRLTIFEYESVADVLEKTGFSGYFQEKSSAKEEYTPPFDLTGV